MSNNYKKWIDLGLSKGLTDIEIHINEKKNMSINVYDSKVEQNEISIMNTASIKGIYNNKMVTIRIEDLSDENVNNKLDILLDSAKNITTNEPALIYEGSKEYLKDLDERFDFSTINPNEKVNLLLNIEKEIRNHPLIKKVSDVSYSETETTYKIINSKGLNLSKHNTYAMIYVGAAYEKNNQIKTGSSYQIVNNYNKFDKDYLVSENIKNGTSQLGAKSIKSNKYPVVFNQEQMGNILTVFSSIFSGEAAYRNLTKLSGKENTKIAANIVNLIDSPMHEEAIFKFPFDSEGVACKERYWIKDGVFTSFAHNLKTAKIFNTKSTGNGFSNTVSETNLILAPGDKTYDEIISSVNEGVYITDLVGLHAGVETVSGDFSLQAAGFIIKDGKIDRPVDMIVLSGNFFELLNNVELIGNDFKFGMSGVGTPTVKIKELMVAGE